MFPLPMEDVKSIYFVCMFGEKRVGECVSN